MKKRSTQPKNNKYYIRTASGGYNAAVLGYPTIKTANVLCNCVGYANGRFNESILDPNLKGIYLPFKYQLVCNAENFIEAAKRLGLKISSTPTLGGIMVWQKGATLSGGDGAGHVAFVEEVFDNGTIITSESGYGGFAFKVISRNNNNGRWGQASGYKFRGCIVNPSIKDSKPTPMPKEVLTVDGIGGSATVAAMQRFFKTTVDGVISGQKKDLVSKYCPSLKSVKYGSGGSACIKALQKWCGSTADGVLGQNTIKAWQKKLKADGYYNGSVDGIFGPASMKAWQQYLNNDGKKKATSTTPATTTKPTTTTSSNASKLVNKAKEVCWPYGTPEEKWDYKTGNPTSAFNKICGNVKRVTKSDCGYFIKMITKAAGLGAWNPLNDSKVPSNFTVVHSGKKIPDNFLKPGDIIWYKKKSGQHTLMFYGDNKIAEAGREIRFPVIRKDTKKYNSSDVKLSTLKVARAK